MKRLLAITIATIFVIMTFASCAKMVDIENSSDTGVSSDSDGYSDVVMDNNSSNTEKNSESSTTDNKTETNKTEDNKTEDNTNKETESDKKQETPTFNVKESTSGLKFVLNDDGLSYTVVGMGSSNAKKIVIDGHNGLPVTKVGYSAFADDSTITSVELGDYVEYIDDYGFSMCKGLTSVKFGKNVKFLGDYSFRYCTALTSIELGKNIEVIKYGTFYNCQKLATIKMYDKVRIIEEYAFDKSAYFNNSSNWKNKVLYIGTNLIKAKTDLSGSYTVTSGTTCIGGLAFYDCKSFSGITIPNSVHSIGPQAFQHANALKNISIGTGVTFIGQKAFEKTGYYNTSGNWKNNVLYIGNYLVATNTALSGSCSINSGTKVIADMAFNGCEKVTSITIPDTVVYIGQYAFRGCVKLSNVTVGSGVKEIGIYAFKDCSALSGINLKKTSGWTADGQEIPTEQISTKEQALVYLGMLHSDKVWKRT